MSVAFDGMDNLVVTFRCSGTVEAGSPVILSANDTVAEGAAIPAVSYTHLTKPTI